MYIIVTLIGNLMSLNWDTIFNTLYKMSDFHGQLFQNIQQLALTSKYIDHHSLLELILVLELPS